MLERATLGPRGRALRRSSAFAATHRPRAGAGSSVAAGSIGPPRPMPSSRRRSASAIARSVARLDREHPLARVLRFGRQDLVGRNEALFELASQVAHVGVDAVERTREDLLRVPGRDQRPEGARDLEPEVGARRRQVFSRGFALRARRAFQRVGAAARIDRPLQVDPRAEVVGDVGIDDLDPLQRLGDAERLDVIGARVAA